MTHVIEYVNAVSFVCAALLSGAAAAANAEPEFELRREQNTVTFKGEIGPESAQALIAQLDSGATLIVISSEGGSVKDALDVANAMRRHQVALQVQDYCFSSCANYLFVAAAEKKLMLGAVLGFHGGASGVAENQQQSKRKKKDQFETDMETLASDEKSFYRSTGFDPALIHLSAVLTISTTPLTFELQLDEDKQVYTFSSEDELTSFLKKRRKTFKNFHFKVGRPSPKVYFPNQHMLIKYGVKGITAYPYPADQAALDVLGKTLGLELIGDFAQQHQQSD
ncbi:hypothetical protein [Undibacterium curvum]|uniref:Periplasmic protein n=1 Tax=Undibacterium curvum TaxID=2762294 RepID=A0ABR7A8M6_9BURK|nr:hypothetical protein [Undibacterium curvum]MBC3933163.1 hypothetical protein [Undibacterium curvum]